MLEDMHTSEKKDHGYFISEDVDATPANINSVLVNPFIGMRHEKMDELIEAFISNTKIEDIYHEVIRKGAFLAQDHEAFRGPRADNLRLKPDEIEALRQEDPKTGNKWNQPWILYALVGTYFKVHFESRNMFWGAVTLQISSTLETISGADDADSKTGCCSLGAAVQGWDETAVNGAQLVSLFCVDAAPSFIPPAT